MAFATRMAISPRFAMRILFLRHFCCDHLADNNLADKGYFHCSEFAPPPVLMYGQQRCNRYMEGSSYRDTQENLIVEALHDSRK